MQRVETLASQLGHRQYCHLEHRGDVAVLLLHYELLNPLAAPVRAALRHYFRRAAADSAVRCVVLAGAGPCFSGGIDMSDFRAAAAEGGGEAAPSLSSLAAMIEESEKIVIAAVHGVAYAGGLELALAAHYRVAALSAVFSFPEVYLGVTPCGGGTQRLPRLVGVRAAVEMITEAKKICAKAALEMGLIDDIVRAGGGKETEEVVELAVRLAAGWKTPRRLSHISNRVAPNMFNRTLLCWLERELRHKTPRDVVAPLQCLKAVRMAVMTSNFADGLAKEREIFMKAIESPDAHAMQYLMRASYHTPNVKLSSFFRESNGMSSFQRICVVGGGTIGKGVILLALRAGIPVTCVEVNTTQRDHVMHSVRTILDKDVKEGRLAPEMRARYDNLFVGVQYDGNLLESLCDVDVVIECVGEDVGLKRRVLARLGAACPPNCVFATAVSSISVGQLASATRRPEKVVGVHFIPPSDVVPLLEVIQGTSTSKDTIARVMELGRRFHKSIVVMNDSFASITTRIIARALYQAFALLEEGAFPIEVDRAVCDFGFRLGLFALDDIAGIDFTTKIYARLQERHRHLNSFTPPFFPSMDVFALSQQLLDTGRCGQKSGRGWFSYDDEGIVLSLLRNFRKTDGSGWDVWPKDSPSLRRRRCPDRNVELMILDMCRKKKILRRDINEKEIVERIVLAMINEAVQILSEGIVKSSATIDVAVVFGCGFPRWKGGPCYYADRFGLANVIHRMKIYNRAFGDLIFPPPCPQLLTMVAEQQTFNSKWP